MITGRFKVVFGLHNIMSPISFFEKALGVKFNVSKFVYSKNRIAVATIDTVTGTYDIEEFNNNVFDEYKTIPVLTGETFLDLIHLHFALQAKYENVVISICHNRLRISYKNVNIVNVTELSSDKPFESYLDQNQFFLDWRNGFNV